MLAAVVLGALWVGLGAARRLGTCRPLVEVPGQLVAHRINLDSVGTRCVEHPNDFVRRCPGEVVFEVLGQHGTMLFSYEPSGALGAVDVMEQGTRWGCYGRQVVLSPDCVVVSCRDFVAGR